MENNRNVCMLSHGDIENDGRVLKTIEYLISKNFDIWVFYVSSGVETPSFISERVIVRGVQKKNGIGTKILRHSFYYFEYNYIVRNVINENISFDFIYVHDFPSLSAGRIIVNKNKNAKLIYDSHEIFNETLNQYFPVNRGLFKDVVFKTMLFFMKKSGYYVEKYLVKKVDLFITVNKSLKDYFEKEYGVIGIVVVMNCPKRAYAEKNHLLKIDYRTQYGWEDKSLIFIYQGVLNQGRGLELLFEAFKNTPEHFKLVIVGNGVLLSSLKKYCFDNNLNDRIKFVGFVDIGNLPGYTQAADVGINLLESFNLSKALASPNKLFEYIHAGIPILASNTFENEKVIQKYNVGVLVGNTVMGVLNGLLYFDDKNALQDKKKFIFQAKNDYNWETQIKNIDFFFRDSNIFDN